MYDFVGNLSLPTLHLSTTLPTLHAGRKKHFHRKIVTHLKIFLPYLIGITEYDAGSEVDKWTDKALRCTTLKKRTCLGLDKRGAGGGFEGDAPLSHAHSFWV